MKNISTFWKEKKWPEVPINEYYNHNTSEPISLTASPLRTGTLSGLALYISLIGKIQKGIFESLKCDVNPQPNARGIGPLVGRTSRYRRSVMHVLAVILCITCHFFIFIRVIWSGRKICPLLMDPNIFLVFQLTTKMRAQVTSWPL